MSKSIEVFETPYCCGVCPYYYEAEKIHLGKFTYQRLFRCRKEPDLDYDEQEEFDPYVNDYMLSKGRPGWCTLRVLTEEEFNKLIDILGDVRTE